jgi:hypothetical protein
MRTIPIPTTKSIYLDHQAHVMPCQARDTLNLDVESPRVRVRLVDLSIEYATLPSLLATLPQIWFRRE